jgi:hypothetical protein
MCLIYISLMCLSYTYRIAPAPVGAHTRRLSSPWYAAANTRLCAAFSPPAATASAGSAARAHAPKAESGTRWDPPTGTAGGAGGGMYTCGGTVGGGVVEGGNGALLRQRVSHESIFWSFICSFRCSSETTDLSRKK